MGRNSSRNFRFKQFTVVDERSAMKVGTDGVLLGAWCGVREARRVLDVGTGCGVVALMVAQRNSEAMIEAIDIDEAAVDEARDNFMRSPWSDRLTANVLNFNSLVAHDEGGKQWDVVVCNPPFFNNGVLPPDASRRQARHAVTLTVEQLLTGTPRLLSPAGALSLITPADNADEVVSHAVRAGLVVQRRTLVSSVEGVPPCRVLWQFACGQRQGAIVDDTLAIAAASGGYTARYAALVGDFYLWG